MMKLEGKTLLLGVGGGISAYKIPLLLRLLQKEGAKVKIMMSTSAKHFLTPFLLQALSGNIVEDDLFSSHDPFFHINATKNADLFLLAPATAQMLAQFAHGFASDLMSATFLASSCPVLIAPSMNVRMWHNPAVQKNVDTLRKNGVWVLNPGEGDLACGDMGEGRLPEEEILIDEVIKSLTSQTLMGKKVVITAGPTYEFLDPVRFISNCSSGKMGLALALEAFYRGAEVELITSCHYRSLPQNIKITAVTSAADMEKIALRHAFGAHIFIANAAVSDYRFSKIFAHKMKSHQSSISLQLVKNNDILAQITKKRGSMRMPFMVGFSLETRKNGILEALRKCDDKRLDMMILNSHAALNSEQTEATLIFGKKHKKFLELGKKDKTEAARLIFDQIMALKPF